MTRPDYGAPVAERAAVDAAAFLRDVTGRDEPLVLRGQVADWPAIAAGRRGHRAMAEYIAGFGGGAPLEVMIGAPEIGGRFFYADEMLAGFNFHRQKVPLGPFVGELLRLAEAEDGVAPPALYANSATAPEHLPGWEATNRLGLPIEAPARLWIGNATRVATHYDMSRNIAAVVAGRRIFTLFPPDALADLYIGPLDNTLAGQPVSMVDPEAPDLARYPRFARAMGRALVAELAPGDALFIPPMWWHHVRAAGPLDVLVNYWWGHESGAAFPALIHAVLAIRDLPETEKTVWRRWFDDLVFSPEAAAAADHLPPAARSVLGPPSEGRTAHIRGFLARMLGRG